MTFFFLVLGLPFGFTTVSDPFLVSFIRRKIGSENQTMTLCRKNLTSGVKIRFDCGSGVPLSLEDT